MKPNAAQMQFNPRKGISLQAYTERVCFLIGIKESNLSTIERQAIILAHNTNRFTETIARSIKYSRANKEKE